MGVLAFFSSGEPQTSNQGLVEPAQVPNDPPAVSSNPADVVSGLPTEAETSVVSTQAVQFSSVTVETQAGVKARRFSLRSFSLVRRNATETKPAIQNKDIKRQTKEAEVNKSKNKSPLSKAEKQAQKSALAIRSVIVGPLSTTESKAPLAPVGRSELNKIKSQLLEPDLANKLIAQLRQLPAIGEPSSHQASTRGPIHAVCLDLTDMEEHLQHFAKLTHPVDKPREISVEIVHLQDVMSASIEALVNLLNEMHIINLITSPDFGLGQPGDGDGLLAGAVPTAETVINGVRQLTPELMALGYATGKAITPDHSGIYPPTDRMSVLTYWWGLELLLPPPSLAYLNDVKSISGAVVNFLTALSLMNEGVREILPFVRYIAQYVDFEFDSIKQQDKWRGVVCAATWIMPAAMVPRPWDFPSAPPKGPAQDSKDGEKSKPFEGSTGSIPVSSPLQTPAYSVLDVVASPSGKLKA
ncbi:hypothetical protein CPB84DRAFT_1770080 [Gymnopilus junonius]|uniref:Uncharacterized protein n=1 Tax=Gymnopilus junonius TaxID=109634 RepID=A0A9P5NU88_GYMJU|nr:hypothetical protein CPB84DRAFT_1770080 [Gymnopilus junonius]